MNVGEAITVAMRAQRAADMDTRAWEARGRVMLSSLLTGPRLRITEGQRRHIARQWRK